MVKRAEAPDDPLLDFARLLTEAAETLVTTLADATRHAPPPRLSALQWQALRVVRRSPGLNLTRLADEVGAAAPAASRLCDRLEAAGLLRREQQPVNRREIGLFLTKHGHEAVEALADQRARVIHDILAHMDPDERAQLLAGLRAFARAAGGPAEGTGPVPS
ncbi:MarR family winged helix-turn-helix transcriptional regulator [Streptomyces sp. NPDC012888]|uniref:MarR family winged helix-turn-helix transcriptional regulator n=1 Tax=Streptomyces sp. NPDC012888 TaxID=3364855 RepID=UPI0036AED6AC